MAPSVSIDPKTGFPIENDMSVTSTVLRTLVLIIIISETSGINANINGVREDPGKTPPSSHSPRAYEKTFAGETPTAAGCETGVSIFSIDYDAPARLALPIQHRLSGTVQGTGQ